MKPAEAKIGAALPKTADHCGLHAIAPAMVSDPEKLRYAVVLLDTGSIETTYEISEFGERYEVIVPKARIRAIEPLAGHGDISAAAQLLERARAERLGELPYHAVSDQ